MLATFLFNIDPVIIHIAGPIAIRWYGVAYILGIFLGSWLLFILSKKAADFSLSKLALDDIVLYSTVGMIIGGRAGYVFFYNFSHYWQDPLSALKIWEGGMSFHGGFLGLVGALYAICKKHCLPFLKISDLIACVAPIGLFFGRLANFINGELYGRVCSESWAVIFPQVDHNPRHPSQLYEALLEGVLLFFILIILRAKLKFLRLEGLLSAIFLVLYGSFRCLVENYREPDIQIGLIAQYFTVGQLLSVPFIISGLYLFFYQIKMKKR